MYAGIKEIGIIQKLMDQTHFLDTKETTFIVHLSSRPYAQVGDGVVPGVVADEEMNGKLLLVTKKLTLGNSLKVQGLGLDAFTAMAPASIHGQGNEDPLSAHAVWPLKRK